MNDESILRHTIDSMFAGETALIQAEGQYKSFKKGKANAANRNDLALALTVLLVDLASCDQNFDQEEYALIVKGLKRAFGVDRFAVQAMVNQATQVLKELRGTDQFAATLRDNLTPEQKHLVMEIIDDTISADGVKDSHELFLRSKFAMILGVTEDAAAKKPESDGK